MNAAPLDPSWVAPDRTALVLVDMQVDFAADDGAMAKAGFDVKDAQAAVAKAVQLAAAARAAGVPLVFVRLITRPHEDSETQREYRTRRGEADMVLCGEGTHGADFVGVQPQGGDYVVSKSRYSGFTGTRLEESLRAMGRDTLVIAGLTTECCVDATARDAFERDFHVFIASDAVAAYEPALHQAALRALELNCAGLFATPELMMAWNNPIHIK
jgi:ureidoacrylate peracid hydrolase